MLLKPTARSLNPSVVLFITNQTIIANTTAIIKPQFAADAPVASIIDLGAKILAVSAISFVASPPLSLCITVRFTIKFDR